MVIVCWICGFCYVGNLASSRIIRNVVKKIIYERIKHIKNCHKEVKKMSLLCKNMEIHVVKIFLLHESSKEKLIVSVFLILVHASLIPHYLISILTQFFNPSLYCKTRFAYSME